MVRDYFAPFFRIGVDFLTGLLHLVQMANGQTAKLTTLLVVQPNVPIGLLKIIGVASVSHIKMKCDLFLKSSYIHTVTMAASWHGGLAGDEEFVKDPTLRADISGAMGYWFGRDFTNDGCLDNGGTPLCPCSNPDNSLW